MPLGDRNKWIIGLSIAALAIVALAVTLAVVLSNNDDGSDKPSEHVAAHVVSPAMEPRLIIESSVSEIAEDTLSIGSVALVGVPPERARPQVYTRRDTTGCYGRVMRLQMPFHSIFLKDRHGTTPYSVCYGRPELPKACEKPDYVYDSMKPRLMVAEMSEQLSGAEAEFDMACTARHLEMTFTLDTTDGSYETTTTEYTIRLNISDDGDGEMGDVLLKDKVDGVFRYFDADTSLFYDTRPANPVSFAPPGLYDQTKEMARHYAIPVPIEILNRLDASEMTPSSLLEITLMPDTSIMFMRHPQGPPSPAWIMRHICLPELTRAISAVVHIL